jgi:prepilin peptidase CpaA
MVTNPLLAAAVLQVTIAVLLYAAFIDLNHYTISNKVIVVLAGLFFLYSLLSGRLTAVMWHVGLAACIFLFLIYFYTRQWMGGGDVKVLTVAFLWTGIECALSFVILLLLLISLHTIAAKLRWMGSQQSNEDRRLRIPFAPSIAGALIATILLGCLQLPD